MSRVLIVDDSEANLYLLRALFTGHGFEVDEATQGAEALAMARKSPPDLIVSDLLMPVVDGYTLLRQWRGEERLRHIPFIVYTATYTEPRDERLAMALGADAFLVKPTEPEVLLDCVRRVMSEKETGGLPSASERPLDEQVLMKEYNEVLVRKLEKKAIELEQTNRDLIAEVAERKRTEAALRESKQRYRNLFEAITDPVFVYDERTLGLLAVNDAAVVHYGYSRDEFLAMTIRDLQPPGADGVSLDTSGPACAALEIRGLRTHRKKNGEIIDVETSTRAVDFDGRRASVLLVRDVTLRLQAESEAARTNSLLSAVTESTSDAIFVKDLDGRYLMFNEAAARFVGKPAAFVIGKDDSEVFLNDDVPVIRANDRMVMESNEIQTFEELLNTAIGPRVFLATKIPYRDSSGQVIGVIGVSRDITEFKHLQDQLRQSQKMEAIGRLAGGVAHDFNNLLTIISGYIDLMHSDGDRNSADREAIEAIRGASMRATRLTRQLLGFSRQTVLQPEVLNLNTVVADMAEMLRRLIGEDILFETVLSDDLHQVEVDPGHMNQILMNLAVNARDAMPKGGRVTVETSNALLTREYAEAHLDCAPGPYVMLSMTDTGCGMPKDVISRIFEPFFTTKDVGEGTGLGLAMVYGIVQQSGGTIHVYSEPGVGTTFRIYLPVATAERTLHEPVPGTARDSGGEEVILLVEDEDAVRMLALLSLSKSGYTVLAASNGQEALRVAGEYGEPIDLVLTDVIMPIMGGPELVETLRPRYPEMRVLFTSGYTDDTVVRHGILEATVSFIQKPYSPRLLVQKVRQVLDGDQRNASLELPKE